jgi:hypothetical protein
LRVSTKTDQELCPYRTTTLQVATLATQKVQRCIKLPQMNSVHKVGQPTQRDDHSGSSELVMLLYLNHLSEEMGVASVDVDSRLLLWNDFGSIEQIKNVAQELCIQLIRIESSISRVMTELSGCNLHSVTGSFRARKQIPTTLP